MRDRENYNDVYSSSEPSWPFWGRLKESVYASTSIKISNEKRSLISIVNFGHDEFEKTEDIAQACLSMLKRRSLNELEFALKEIFTILDEWINHFIDEEIEKRAQYLNENGGWELSYLRDGLSGSIDEIRDLLINWSSEWDDVLDLPSSENTLNLTNLIEYLNLNKYENTDLINLGLVEPQEFEYFALLALAKVCYAVHFESFYQRDNTLFSISVTGTKALIESIEALSHAKQIKFEEEVNWAISAKQPEIISAEIERRIKERENEAKKKLSLAGIKGAELRKQRFEPLAVWVLSEVSNMSGDNMLKARRLSATLPSNLADISKNPQRWIYEFLNSKNKM